MYVLYLKGPAAFAQDQVFKAQSCKKFGNSVKCIFFKKLSAACVHKGNDEDK